MIDYDFELTSSVFSPFGLALFLLAQKVNKQI